MKHVSATIKAVLFDHDDTLVGTIGSKWAEHKLIAKKYYGKDVTDDHIRDHWGKPLEELIRLLYAGDDVENALSYHEIHHTDFEKELFAGTVPALKKLKEAGLKIGVITATSRYSFDHDLDHHNFPQELLDYTQTADDTDCHKPDPKVFEPALKWLSSQNILPEEVMYVGDGLHDMKAATGAGFNFLGVHTGLVTAEEFAQHDIKSVPDIGHVVLD